MMPDNIDHTEEPKTENNPTKGLDIASVAESWGFKGQNYLFIIGIDQYQHWPMLHCAVKDVQDFAAVLLKRYQFDDSHCMILLNQEATLKNILIKFRELFQKITPEDNLIVYFSGHGHFDELTKTGYWIPVEALTGEENEYQFMNTAIIFDKLRNINTLHTFLIIDACFSGTLLHQIRAEPRSERYKSRLVFASGRAEVVSDGQEGGNSPFAKGILNGLTLNTDKYISASKLILEAKEYIEKEAQQTPTDARLINADDQGGDFVFHLKMSEAEIWANVVSQDTQEAYLKFMEQFPRSEHQPEAQEAYDWLVTSEEHSIRSLSHYLQQYQPRGKHVQLAISMLDTIEEEQRWIKAKNKDTLAAYFDYLTKYPDGKHAGEARKMTNQIAADEDDTAFKKALEKDTLDAYQDYIHKQGGKKYIEKAQEKLLKLSSQTTEPSPEQAAWDQASRQATYKTYLDFIQAFPQSQSLEEARKEMKRLDDIALNKIRLMQYDSKLSIQEKINRCIQYFNDFPGADNNVRVKQIKDQLELKKYSREN